MKQLFRPVSMILVLVFISCLNSSPISFAQDQIENTILETNPVDTRYQDLVLPSVRIHAGNSGGSGVVLNKLYVLTAKHVIEDVEEDQLFIEFPPKMVRFKASVEVMGNDTDLDYVILRIGDPVTVESEFISPEEAPEPFEPKHFVKRLSKEDFRRLKTTDRIFNVGYPFKSTLHISEGFLCGQEDGYYKTSAPITYGNSGGGSFTEKNQLIGIVVRVRLYYNSPVYHINFLVRLDRIYQDIEKKKVEYIWEGIEGEPEKSEEKDSTEESEEDESNSSTRIIKIKDLEQLFQK